MWFVETQMMADVKTAKASVELTKNDEGTWLNIEIGGRKATLSLNNSNHGPMVREILTEWGESHFQPIGPVKKTLVLLGECLLAGITTLVLVGILGEAIYLIYNNAGNMAQGFGLALGAGLLGGAVRYFKVTRRLMGKLFNGGLFR
jgi:hypothetical protein